MMLGAAVFAQVMFRKNRCLTPPTCKLPLIGVIAALTLMVIGLLAIGRLP